MEERRKWKHQSTEDAKREYRRLNNKTTKNDRKNEGALVGRPM